MTPFSNGSEFTDWFETNCGPCARGTGCPMYAALADAFLGDGTIPEEMADRIGVYGGRLNEWCLEFVTPAPSGGPRDGGGDAT